MEVEEVKQHEGIQQYYITKIEALQVYAIKCIYLISFLLRRFFTLLCTSWHLVDSVGWASTKGVGSDIFKPWPDQPSWSLNNWGEIAVSVMTAGNGESCQMAPINQKLHLITLWLFFNIVGCKEPTHNLWRGEETPDHEVGPIPCSKCGWLGFDISERIIVQGH